MYDVYEIRSENNDKTVGKNQKNNHYFEMRLVCKQITHHTTDSWTNGVHVRGGSRSLQWN
jgi:hypothetical protein